MAHRPIAWFTVGLMPAIAAIFGVEVGSHTGQQRFEALAILVALRAWKERWRHTRSRLGTTSDNEPALTVVATMKAAHRGMITLARELALDLLRGVLQARPGEPYPGGVADGG